MGRPLRVLLISHGLPPESVGGVEQHVDGLARALARRGCEVTIYSRTGAAGVPEGTAVDDRLGDVPVTRVAYRHGDVRGFEGVYRSPLLDEAFARFLAGRTFDVAHVHHLTGLSVGVLEQLADHGIPTVLTLHDYWMMCPRGQMWHPDGTACPHVEVDRCAPCFAATFPHWFGPDREDPRTAAAALHESARRLLALPSTLVVPSARAIPPFAALGVPPERIRVVENAVATDDLRPLPAASPPPDGPLRVGYLGTLIPSKGLDVLVEAVTRLPADTVRLDIHGNAPPYHGDEGFLTRTFARLEPGHDVHYHGPYAGTDLPRILAGLDVVAAPALWHEAFGLTVREALAAGRPVLVSTIGGLQDAVDDGVEGHLLPPGDPAAWAAALAGLAADPDRVTRMGRAGRRRCRAFPDMAAQLEGLYRSVAALESNPPAP